MKSIALAPVLLDPSSATPVLRRFSFASQKVGRCGAEGGGNMLVSVPPLAEMVGQGAKAAGARIPFTLAPGIVSAPLTNGELPYDLVLTIQPGDFRDKPAGNYVGSIQITVTP